MKKKHPKHTVDLKKEIKETQELFEKGQTEELKRSEHMRSSTNQYLKGAHTRGRSGHGG